MDAPRPHDLLFLREPAAFVTAGAAPERPRWLMPAAPVVVRREATAAGVVPVGARGLARNERCKGYADAAAVARRVTPEMLRPAALTAGLPCLEALRVLGPQLDALGVAWGPTGGVGFHLASALPVLREASDLDLLVRLPRRPPAALVDALCALQAGLACRIDIQLDTGTGGCALLEYARGGRVLLKTAHGPRFTDDPWQVGVPA